MADGPKFFSNGLWQDAEAQADLSPVKATASTSISMKWKARMSEVLHGFQKRRIVNGGSIARKIS